MTRNDHSYNNISVGYPEVNGNWNQNNGITERQSGENFQSSRRICRFLTRRQCRQRENNLLNKKDEAEDILIFAESRPSVDSYFYPRGNIDNSHVCIYICV